MTRIRFMDRFVDPIRHGRKSTTIRARTEPRMTDMALALESGEPVELVIGDPIRGWLPFARAVVTGVDCLKDVMVSYDQRQRLAESDGFRNWGELQKLLESMYGRNLQFASFMVIRFRVTEIIPLATDTQLEMLA